MAVFKCEIKNLIKRAELQKEARCIEKQAAGVSSPTVAPPAAPIHYKPGKPL